MSLIALIDNYDSFTYNLFQVLATLGAEVRVIRNDQIDLPTLKNWQLTHLMISPGPGDPDQAGISMEAIRYFSGRVPVLGVCLGHQSLAQVFGGRIIRADRIMHGKTSPIHHRRQGVFARLASPFDATRYHSLLVERESLPQDFEITAWTAEEEIMGLLHKPTGAQGVQFHPESILTHSGHLLLEEFLRC